MLSAVVEGNLPGESNALMVQVPAIVFFILTPIFVGIRFWSRIKMRSGIGWDDWTILFSFFCCLTVSVLMMISCEYGFGQHIKNLSKPKKLMTLKTFYVAQIFYKITINLTKASILLLYLRIFVQRYFRILCHVLLSIILTYMVATSASSIWQCTPVPRAWDKSIPGTCISLTMNWALMIIFALGLFVTITSILRMTTLDFSTNSPDTTFDIASTLWTLVEDNLAIICACLPMCRLPLTYIFPSYFPSKKGSSAGSYKISSAPHTNDSAFTYASTNRDDWHTYPEREERNRIHMKRVQAKAGATVGVRSGTSEECILPVDTEVGNIKAPSEDDVGCKVIRKTTASYEL
ncbi:hypothetical protein LX32DRAFT_727918 [Colletotrichum zoysiae]|uniref:Rhodopsin domain-containing protein n=1 Tax=Colletotrichum zoysiae TaxID=1216348 RepID=A0AAD9HJS3_9PEZI|nr:hypothetical protein LX32DRAFT_727918 [Colletotrichum zoysiae]